VQGDTASTIGPRHEDGAENFPSKKKGTEEEPGRKRRKMLEIYCWKNRHRGELFEREPEGFHKTVCRNEAFFIAGRQVALQGPMPPAAKGWGRTKNPTSGEDPQSPPKKTNSPKVKCFTRERPRVLREQTKTKGRLP